MKLAIATPSYDGKVSTSYLNSSVDLIYYALSQGDQVSFLNVSHESLVQRARNQLLSMFLDTDHDYLLWIDADIVWEPMQVYKLLKHKVDVVGAAYPTKEMREGFVLKRGDKPLAGTLLEVDGLGFGFLLMSRAAASALWELSAPYSDKGSTYRSAFEVVVRDGDIWSEDITACEKLRQLGYPVFLDTRMNLGHIGTHTFNGDLRDYLEEL